MDKNDIYKRKRSENWNEDDKILLKDLIRQNVSRIENKNTDTNTNQAKKKAWLDVAESFNDLCTGGQRNLTQLKTQWAATKITARKEVSQHRKAIFKTGGGPQPEGLAASSSDIASWLPNEFIVDVNKFDSDFITEELNAEIVDDGDIVMPPQNDVIVIDGTQICKETEFTPKSIPILTNMLHIKYPHGRALAEVNTMAVTTGQHTKGRNSNNVSSTTVEFQPDLLPAYAGNKINSKQQQQQHQEDKLYSPVIIPVSTSTNKIINMMEDQQLQQQHHQHLVTAHTTPPINATSRSKYNTSAQEYLQARFGTITKKQTKSQEKLNTIKREAPTGTALATGTSSLTVTRSSPNPTDAALQQTSTRQTKSLFLPQRTVCSATTTVTPTDTNSSYEYRQPPPPPYNATHRTAGNLLMTRRTSINQHDNSEDNNKNSNTKDQGYRELGGSSAVGIPLYETARQTIVTASPSMNFPTTITGYNTNTASPRRQLL